MKAKLIVARPVTHPDLIVTNHLGVIDAAATHRKIQAVRNRIHQGEISAREAKSLLQIEAAAGTVIDHPAAYLLVGLGIAEPADAECKARCEAIEHRLPRIQAAADKLAKAQLTGDPTHDATNEQAEQAADKRRQRIKTAG